MKKTIDQLIANELCQAQCASDAGKLVYRLNGAGMNYRHSRRYKYTVKSVHLINALRLCDSAESHMFRYWVAENFDQNGYPSVLVYFTFKFEGKRHQISFHTPLVEAHFSGLYDWVGKGMRQRWDRRASFETAKILEKIATGG